jgi:phage/plasmid-associated DNA primase
MVEAACLLRTEVADGGRLAAIAHTMLPYDSSYLKSARGPINFITNIKDPKFANRLDELSDGCVAFDNGMFDVRTGAHRPFTRDDLVSTTIGYDYVPSEGVPDDMHAFVEEFYAQVFPVPEEREYFLRVIARALFANEQSEHFLVLSDEHHGSSGKTTLMRAVESVFGNLHAHAERDFLYEETHACPCGANANFLAYIGKRIAFFDEPSKRLDLLRIKDLTSGDACITGRRLHSNDVVEAP